MKVRLVWFQKFYRKRRAKSAYVIDDSITPYYTNKSRWNFEWFYFKNLQQWDCLASVDNLFVVRKSKILIIY